MPIHRFVDPTYDLGGGAFPGVIGGITYDRINVGSGGVGGAPADLAKVGGVNPGTYWVSFSEDATSLNTNRGFRALSENSDVFDDFFHQDIVAQSSTTIVLGAPTNLITLPAGMYLGVSGTAVNVTNLERLVTVLVAAGDDEVLDVATGTKVRALAVAGFPNSPTPPFLIAPAVVTLSHALPAGTYVVRFGTRANLTNVGSRLFEARVGQDHRVPAYVQNLFRILRAPAAQAQAWDANPFTSTIYDLAASGLNERYNRAKVHDTTVPANTDYPLPIAPYTTLNGQGSWFTRSGPAMGGWSQRSLSTAFAAGQDPFYVDPIDGVWLAHLEDTKNTLGNDRRGGASGFVTYSAKRSSIYDPAANQEGVQPALAKFMGLAQRDELGTNDVGLFTHITPGSTVTFNVVGPDIELTLAPGDYFYRNILGVLRSGLALQHSLLEISHLDNLDLRVKRRTYIITSWSASNTCTLVRIDGGTPDVNNAVTGTLTRVLSLDFFVGDGLEEYRRQRGLASGILPSGLTWAKLPATTDAVGKTVVQDAAKFYGSSQSGAEVVLQWGGFRLDQVANIGYEPFGFLTSDGSVVTQGNVYAVTGATGAVNGVVAGKQLAQVIQTNIVATRDTSYDVRSGMTMYFRTTYAGADPITFVDFNYTSINASLDSTIRYVIHRTNPATGLTNWLPRMWSDNGVTPVLTYINIADLYLGTTFGAGGAVDVFEGKQIGNAVYWQVVGHYPVPLGAIMDRTFPRQFPFSQYGHAYDPEVVSYGTTPYQNTNKFLRGGVATGFSFARDIDLTGRTTSAYPLTVPVLDYIFELPLNAGHGVNAANNKPPVILIDAVGIAVTRAIVVQNSGGDAFTTVDLEVGLANNAIIVQPLCRMSIGMGTRDVTGSVDMTTLTYPVSSMTGTQLWVGLNGADPVVVNFLVGDINNSTNIIARIQATLDASFGVGTALVGLTTSNHLFIRSLSPLVNASVQVAFGDPAPMARLGFTQGQTSLAVPRNFTNNAGDAEFGLGAFDANMALNEGWGPNINGNWFAVEGTSKKLMCSPPVGGSVVDRIMLSNYNLTTSGADTITDGQITIWVSGSILSAY